MKVGAGDTPNMKVMGDEEYAGLSKRTQNKLRKLRDDVKSCDNYCDNFRTKQGLMSLSSLDFWKTPKIGKKTAIEIAVWLGIPIHPFLLPPEPRKKKEPSRSMGKRKPTGMEIIEAIRTLELAGYTVEKRR